MKMKKSILCLLLVLSLCLCMIFASCKPDEVETETGDKLGQVHTTPDTSAGVDPSFPNPQIGNETPRY
jgi:ABC-type oligopeptide transport system substrate-binding subunit